jgi:hypothetical protein
LLNALGAPVTSQNVAFLDQWALQEEPSATAGYSWNPFNIEANGGVQNFASPAAGIAATSSFMQNGYGDIVNALRSGDPTGYNLSNSLRAWSGGGYSSISGFGGSTTSPSSSSAPMTTAGQQNQRQPLFTGFFAPLESGLAQSAIMLGAFILVGIGGLWIVLSNDDARSAITTTAKTAGKAALAA